MVKKFCCVKTKEEIQGVRPVHRERWSKRAGLTSAPERRKRREGHCLGLYKNDPPPQRTS